jgi:OMF family outer membrane factor
MVYKVAFVLGVGIWRALASAQEPMTLEQAVEIAKKNAFAVLTAQEEVRRAGGAMAEAKGALLPKLTLDARYTRFVESQSVIIDPNEPPVVIRPIDQKSLALSLSQPIDIFNVSSVAVAAARSLYLASQAELKDAVDRAALEAKDSFFGVLRTEEIVKVATDKIASVQEALRVAKLKNQEGAAAKFDVIRFQSDLANAEQQRIQAENDLDTAKSRFNVALARDIETPVSLVKPAEQPKVALSLEELTAKAVDTRPDLLAAKRRLKYQEQFRIFRQREGLPTLNLSGNVSYNPDVGGFGGASNDASATLALSVPILEGGVHRARITQAKAEEEKAKIEVNRQTLAVTREVRDAYLDVEAARQQIATAQQALELAQEALRIARLRYEAGVGIPLELSDANAQLSSAQTNFVNATYAYRDAVSKLQQAVGSEDIIQ